MADSEPPLERIRPCLHCGALMPYSARACPECAQAPGGAPREGDEVWSCPQCGTIVSTEENPCPQCGAPSAASGGQDEVVRACRACEVIIPFDELYCHRCGELAIEIEQDEIPPEVELEDSLAWSARVPELLGLATVGIGLVTLGIAAWWGLR